MKKLIAATLLACCAGAVYAHPPAKIEAKFSGDQLDITITHNVKDAAKHFIDDIIVKFNGQELAVQKCLRQTDNDTQLAVYRIAGLKKGDKLSVTAKCNKSGEKTVEVSVP
ncbi:MAG: hypothetical protein WCS77_06055 [Elusimicrobiaceae bacterium]